MEYQFQMGKIKQRQVRLSSETTSYFDCEYCRDTVDTSFSPPTCQGCGTAYRFDAGKNTFNPITSRAQVFDFIAAVLMITCIAIVLATDGESSTGWFFGLCGFALHYGNGLRNGVLNTRFFFLKSSWTIYQIESPYIFTIASLVEGVMLLFFILIFLISL
ncbi:MAG: hypothetical protein K0Q55_3412 [Verrucomicrobia bacterium]|jgi:hypothetical protein|nr:hypothetical protein [Verrucomicrobiota bacterium]